MQKILIVDDSEAIRLLESGATSVLSGMSSAPPND